MDAGTKSLIREQEELRQFINRETFPCLMAKAMARAGLFTTLVVEEIETEASLRRVLSEIHHFVREFRSAPKRLSSFTLVIKDGKYLDFPCFEKAFWECLRTLYLQDKDYFSYDPRVSSSPEDSEFSFSLGAEAFFILALHPESPRWSRRFRYPTIVFNPHIQFERMRANGSFKRIRDIIRLKDKLLQGAPNPMLSDFGEESEVFQYLGIRYPKDAKVPLKL